MKKGPNVGTQKRAEGRKADTDATMASVTSSRAKDRPRDGEPHHRRKHAPGPDREREPSVHPNGDLGWGEKDPLP